MRNKSKYVLFLYIIIGALQVTGILLKIPLFQQSLKVLLMPVLTFYLWNGTEEKTKTTLFRLSILALVFSYFTTLSLLSKNILKRNPIWIIGIILFLTAFYTVRDQKVQ